METFSALLAICAGNSSGTGEFLAQRPVTRSFNIFFICVWINGWVNNREAGDVRRYRAYYDVTLVNFLDVWLLFTGQNLTKIFVEPLWRLSFFHMNFYWKTLPLHTRNLFHSIEWHFLSMGKLSTTFMIKRVFRCLWFLDEDYVSRIFPHGLSTVFFPQILHIWNLIPSYLLFSFMRFWTCLRCNMFHKRNILQRE